ncbi:MAG: adenine-specific DNA methylase [Candidatus Scalindua rubra]|uniref:site-specific DNA-methyltransferase (adenine-specific) n=1 Tax=Candidatus Scalindua rubra TaxID=1872076 RepID=A0A1E3X9Y9_9BACT|nr:MAG: adenine-specific DNA methylase [Candidatus Scalindua rubra]
MSRLSKKDRQRIIEILESGEALPLDYKHILFPPEKKEYELVYAGKEREEDILADTMAVPLQPIKTFGKNGNGWTNKLIFGDNLQVMKSLLDDPDVKGQAKLIYIDPPFGTGDEYSLKNGQGAYSAKKKGAEFIEFLRKRLILLRELLSNDGVIFCRIDYHFGHYIKAIMDEVFGGQNFQNDIVINRFKRMLKGLKKFNVATDNTLFYSRVNSFHFKTIEKERTCTFCGNEIEPIWRAMSSPGLRRPPERVIFGKMMYPPQGRHWTFTQKRIQELISESRLRINNNTIYTDINGNKIRGMPEYLQTETIPIDSNWTDLKGYVFNAKYPTENPEELLERVIESSSKRGELVIDAFVGSGTTLAVAEKLSRRWIGIDCGKLAIYTTQKRMLNLKKEIGNKGKSLKPKPFTLYHAGLYDFPKLKKLPWKDWRLFALHLFNCRDYKHTVSGIDLDGYKGRSDVLVFNYQQEGGVVLDYGFIDDLHSMIGSKVGKQFFIISPAASVMFLEDYIDKGSTRYYILRIPYSIINELHNRDFEAIKQPIDESEVNDTVDAVGFDFVRQPKVECEYMLKQVKEQSSEVAAIKIKTFKSEAMLKGASQLGNRESLSMVMVDFDYDGEIFNLDKVYYASDLVKNGWEVHLPVESIKNQMMIIYLDIYGNEYREIKSIKDFNSSHKLKSSRSKK